MNASLTPPETMQAARYYAPGDARVETVDLPIAAAAEVIVKIAAATTCGTDLKCFQRGHPVLLKSMPSPFGHEGAGIISQVGDGVTRFSIGERVVMANSAPCASCFFCHKGQPNLCESLDLLNGTYAEYIRVPAPIVARNTYHVPDSLPLELAALTEPLAVSLRCVLDTPVQPGDHVAVLGVGAIGQMIIRLAHWQGATVTAFGRNRMRLALAESFGQAASTVNLSDGLPDAATIRRTHTTGGHGFDVVIEAIGLPQTWAYAVDLVRKGGIVNWFAGCEKGSEIVLDTRRIHYDEIRLLSLFHHTPQRFEQALQLQASGEIDLSPLLTHRLPLADFVAALGLVERGEAVKVVLTP